MSRSLSKSIFLETVTEATEVLSTDTKVSAEPQEMPPKPLGSSKVDMGMKQNSNANSEKTSRSAPLCLNNEDGKDLTRGEEMTPNNVISCHRNELENLDDLASLECDLVIITKDENTKNVSDSKIMTNTGAKTSTLIVSNKSEESFQTLNGDTIMMEDQVSSLQLSNLCNSTIVSEHMLVPTLHFNLSPLLNAEEYYLRSKSKDESRPSDLYKTDKGKCLPKYSCKTEEATVFVEEGTNAEDSRADGEESNGKKEKTNMILQDKNGLPAQLSASESAIIGKSFEGEGNMNSDFSYEGEKFKSAIMIDQGMQTANVFAEKNLGYNSDTQESTKLLAFSSNEQQWESSSSFTILYEDTLPLKCAGSHLEDTEPHLHSPSDLSLENNHHLLMCETGKNKPQPIYAYEKDNKLNETLDNCSSESFMAVEAKRCRIYPFSLSPIYEDDSSQEDLHSTDVSPGDHCSKNSNDNANQSASILSLLQSVSERLKFSKQREVVEEESYEEGKYDEQKVACASSQWTENGQEGGLLPRQSLVPSRELLRSKQQTGLFVEKVSSSSQLQQKMDPSTKPLSRNVYYQYLQSANNYSTEKGPRFGSILLQKDCLSEKNLSKLGTFQSNLIDRESLKCNPRPGKIIICDIHGDKNKQEVYQDMLDATAWTFPNGALFRVVRGCWILYEKPKFQGQKYVLEEGEMMLNNIWDTRGMKHQSRSLTIGSIKRVTKVQTLLIIVRKNKVGAI
uniref:Beta/gamma crystallin 'Greek key' domain-containing protein n=1 Tax=Sphenodon punctatus TaxID=8508 RepID=A0A8D0GQD4_SPHPU